MQISFKTIHIGSLIKLRVLEKEIETDRICNFLKCSEEDILKIYDSPSIDADLMMKWSKLLDYDFFRIYTQHLILFSPPDKIGYKKNNQRSSKLPQFRKNIYTKEVIDFILEMIRTEKKTKQQIIDDYNIPKTTLYKWIEKYFQNTQ
jgi:hypothetical protein